MREQVAEKTAEAEKAAEEAKAATAAKMEAELAQWTLDDQIKVRNLT